MKHFILAFLLVFSICFPVSLITKAGEFYSGQIVEENADYIVLMTETGVLEINNEDIKEKIITFDIGSPVAVRDYGNKKGLRFSYASGLGEQIPVHGSYHYVVDNTTKDVFINQISEFGMFYYYDLPEDYSVEVGTGILNRLANVGEVSNKNGFSCNFLSFTIRRMLFNSLNGGYHFNVGMGLNYYMNSLMKAYDSTLTEHQIKYKDAIGYHFLVEAWSNMPKVWVFDDMNFVMSLRWNFGASFVAEATPAYTDWNNIGLNGFMFNTAIAFLW
jgi:hypothetical protein